MPAATLTDNSDKSRSRFADAMNLRRPPPRRPSPGKRRVRTDDSIIRGAAIIRDHIQQQNSDVSDTEHPTMAAGQPTGQQPKNNPASPARNDDVTNFSDPWCAKRLSDSSSGKPPRAVTPDTTKLMEDESSFAFGGESSFGGSGGGSHSSPMEWAHRALSAEDAASTSLSVQSNHQPDTDPCDPPLPPRSRNRGSGVGITTVTSYSLVGPIVSDVVDEEDYDDEDDDDSHNGYDFVERDYEAEFDEDDKGPRSSYLSTDMRGENLNDRGKRGGRRRGGKNGRARILQLVTSNHEDDDVPSPEPPPKKGPQSTGARCAIDNVVSPLSVEYSMLLQDPAFRHAQTAGHLWQSLVGSQIRFPSSWWNGARGPPMGLDNSKPRKWQFFGRYPSANPNLRRYVKHRSAPGRMLLHIVVQDLVTWRPVQDIVVGCFDPNSRGIRTTDKAQPGKEEFRELWLAVRKRTDSVSVIDSLLSHGRSWSSECKGPLGPRQRITNTNVRAVFGEEPPVETIFVHESTLYERLVAGRDQTPPLFLVHEFVFC